VRSAFARRLALALLAVAGAAAALLLLAHLPWVQARVARWALSQLETRGLAVRVRALSYNLLTRSVHVEGLAASTPSDPRQPFLEADSLDVTLSRSVFAGRLAIASLRGDGVRVAVARRQDGSTNLPRFEDRATGSASPFPIAAIALSNASVAWQDDVLGMGAVVSALSVNLDQMGGRVVLGRPATLRAGGRETSVTAGAKIGWDGATLSFEALRLQAPEGTLNAAGTVGLLAAGHPLKVEGRGSADLDQVAGWFALDPHPLGDVRFQVRVAGSTADPTADVTLTSQDLAWRDLDGVAIDAALHADGNALDAGRVTVRALGGTASGSARVSFAAAGERARVALDWRDIDAARLLTALGASPTPAANALIDGRLRASSSSWSVETLSGTFEATTRRVPPTPRTSQEIGLAGSATLAVRDGAWRGTIDQWIDAAAHVEGRAEGRLAAASLGASTVNATVAATSDALPGLWRTLRKFDLVSGDPPASVPGGIRADLTLSGRVDNPRLAGRVEATLPAIDRLLAGAPSNLGPSGALSLSATVAGTVKAPAIDGTITGDALSIAGQRADRLDASFGLNAQVASIERLALTQSGGQLTMDGRYDLRTGAVTAHLAAGNLMVTPVPGAQPGEVLVPLSARLTGDLQLGGTAADPEGSGHLVLDDARVREREIGHVETGLNLAGHQLHATVTLADLFTTGTATLTVRPPADGALVPGAFVIDTQTTGADLGMLAARFGLASAAPVAGRMSFAAHADGVSGDIAHADTSIDIQQLDATIGDVPVRTAGAARATYDGRTVEVTGLALDIGVSRRSRLRVAGRLGPDAPGTMAASLDGEAGDLRQIALIFSPAGSVLESLQLDGRVHVDVRAPGSLDRPALAAEASLDGGRIARDGQAEAATLVVRASYGAGVLTLSQLTAMWQTASVSATGDIPIALVAPDAPVWLTGGGDLQGRSQTGGRLRARIDSVTPAVLAPFVPAETLAKLTGLVSGTLALDADRPVLGAVRGQLVLDHVNLVVAGVAFDQQQPTRVDVADGRARIASWTWGGAGNAFTVGGSVTFDGTQAIDISADGSVDLRALGAFLPQVTTAGRGAVAVRVTGTPAAPQVNGRIDLRDGELRVASPRMVVSDLAGSLLFSRDEVTVRDVYGQANGGTLSVLGTLKHSGTTLTGGRVAITGRGLAMAIPEALKTEVDLDLTLAPDRGALALSGDATVLGGAYREPISIATGFLQSMQASRTTIQLDAPSAIDAMALDVRLTTSEDIVVDNNYARLGLAADVRIRGTVAAPVLFGRAEAREGGRIFLGGNVYQIVGSGAIDFSNPTRIEPDLQITAVTRVAGHTITLVLKGPPATLQTTLTSDDGLSQGEIVSLLVTGQTQNASAMAISSDQVIGYLSGEVLGVTGRALGLDALRVERGQDVRFDAGLVATETDPSSRLTFGKQVTRQVEVVFSQSLKDSGHLTWIVGYRPRSNIELRMVSQDNQGRIYDFRHDVTIGGVRTRAAASLAAPRVASVRIAGTPDGPDDAALRSRLKVTEGKAFDFFRWQQDRDRIEEWLRQDNHFEARVSARRSAAEKGAAVALTYDVDRGPKTIVDLTGIPEDGSLRREIERIWSQAIFDAFLLEQAEKAARAAMVRDGYVGATVTTSVTQPDGAPEKHLVVAVQPGPRYAQRRLVFSGQEHVGADRLDELAGSVASPWVDSAPLVQAITTMYRNEGFLDAGVSVGPPQLSGDSAVLPVVVREGPQFVLQSVAFAGLRTRTAAADERAFGLKPGAPLTRAAADKAVQDLANAYRAGGFNVVRITLTSEATRATGLVALTVNVDEGPRQVLRDVSIEGTRRTSPALVSHELRLEIGQPVDLSAWAQARKRLFDTGIFRQVDIQAVKIEPAEGAAPPAGGTEDVEPIRARVVLEEFAPLRVRYGFEVDDQVQPASETRTLRPGLAADATYRNLFGRAATTGLALRYTKDFKAARSFFSTPSFLGLPLTSNVFLARSREELGTATSRPYLVDKSEFTAEQRFRPGRRLQVAYSYSFQRNHTFDRDARPDDPFAFDLTINVARLTATALVDTRNDLVDATRGLLTSSTFEYGVAALGSDLRFAKYFFQQNYYRPLGGGVVFATSGRLGLAAGYGQDLIRSEKFYAGGGNSVRGFREDGLGPVDVFGDPAGGNALLVFNEELRFPIAWRFRGVGFFDAGNVFTAPGDLGFGALRAGAGVGLRVETPFALIRVDLGTPLGARPGEARARWFFSIGQSF